MTTITTSTNKVFNLTDAHIEWNNYYQAYTITAQTLAYRMGLLKGLYFTYQQEQCFLVQSIVTVITFQTKQDAEKYCDDNNLQWHYNKVCYMADGSVEYHYCQDK